MIPAAATLAQVASASPATTAMQSYVMPIVTTLCVLASLACVFFLVWSGVQYMTSTGDPEKLDHAKRTIRNALIGLVLVLAAVTLTAVLSHAYISSAGTPAQKLPDIAQAPSPSSSGVIDALIKTIVGLLRSLIEMAGTPFVQALSYFTNSTPFMGDNATVFNLWLAVVGMTDVLFILAIILLGFHIMSFSVFGFEEVDIKQLLPQLALIFLLLNTSIFLIDGVIGLSNAMIHALQSGFLSISIWDDLALITKKSSDMGLAGLLVMISFLVVAVILLLYYVGRLISLYVGAILSPLVILLWLIPAFKDFAIMAIKVYLTLIFVLFVHAVIILLAASIFNGMLHGDTNGQPNTLMALLLGLATLLALLRTQGVMEQFAYAATGPRAIRELSGSFIRGVSHLSRTAKTTVKTTKKTYKAAKKVNAYLQKKFPAKTPRTKTPTRDTASTSYSKPLKTGEVRKATKEQQ